MKFDVDLTEGPQERGHAFLDDLDRIRETEPIFWSETSRCWFATKHEDVSDMLMRRLPVTNEGRMFAIFQSVPQEEWATRLPNMLKYTQLWIVSTEGERHARLRSLLMKAMNRRTIEALRPYARQRAEGLLDMMIAAGDIEFNEQIARPMTGDVLFKMLGMPEERMADLRDWATWLIEGAGAAVPTPERLERADLALAKMNEAVLIELEKRRVDPKDDLITAMLHASENGDKLTEDEILAQMHVAIVAGHDTTMNTLTLSVEALGRDPEAWAYVQANPDKMPAIVAELQRHIGMAGGQPRLVEEDFEIGGKQIKKGQMMAVLIASANRDPDVFANPDKIDFTRDNSKSMVFAPGVHFCLGHHMAKMQLTEFLGAFGRKIRTIEILDDKPVFLPVWVFRGVYALNVRATGV